MTEHEGTHVLGDADADASADDHLVAPSDDTPDLDGDQDDVPQGAEDVELDPEDDDEDAG